MLNTVGNKLTARKAVEAGAAGVIVSNHGARQLDYAPATISALEEVVKAVAGAIPVLVDGGVRRGTDVLKALALGARAVMVRSSAEAAGRTLEKGLHGDVIAACCRWGGRCCSGWRRGARRGRST